jgi:hypothetical protein
MAYSATLSGSGAVSLLGLAENPEYALAHVITAGPLVRTPFDGTAHLVTKVGWFAFGAQTDRGFGTDNYTRDPIWINSMRFIWGIHAGAYIGGVSVMRYYFSAGTSVYLLVGP